MNGRCIAKVVNRRGPTEYLRACNSLIYKGSACMRHYHEAVAILAAGYPAKICEISVSPEVMAMLENAALELP